MYWLEKFQPLDIQKLEMLAMSLQSGGVVNGIFDCGNRCHGV